MAFRKLFARWLQLAPIVLPVWLFVGWALWGGSAWGVLGLAVLTPVVFVVLGVLALLVWARPAVRTEKAVTWRDVGMFGILDLAIIGIGFYGDAAVGWTVVAVIAAIVAFWYALIALLQDGARAAKTQFDAGAAFERGAGAPGQVPPFGPATPNAAPTDLGEVIVVREARKDGEG
ncbi:hypothetical protein [Agromyces seonyuensis]|uniref:Uncharacterized protein n=1 Tax=Agromyces seonyuensis TaxID=2662446 RepID=A0A6I4NV92_9MICO|nr:hypothetical protein [Agromyces seonyuensis]MWB98298.1 hypothetical protein [Agromyces seonyuensis]